MGSGGSNRLKERENHSKSVKEWTYVLTGRYNKSTFTLRGWRAMGGFEQTSAMN